MTVLSTVEAARVNQAARDRAAGMPSGRARREAMELAQRVDGLLESIGGTAYFSAWVIVETASID